MAAKVVKYFTDRQSTIASGVAALLIIVGGFLVFNYFSSQNRTKASQVSQEATQSAQVTPSPSNSPSAPTPSSTTPAASPSTLSPATTTLPTTYTVVKGDSLSAVAQKFYGDGSK